VGGWMGVKPDLRSEARSPQMISNDRYIILICIQNYNYFCLAAFKVTPAAS
jgi:hypothetical protein